MVAFLIRLLLAIRSRFSGERGLRPRISSCANSWLLSQKLNSDIFVMQPAQNCHN
jgi:hypothetical protein